MSCKKTFLNIIKGFDLFGYKVELFFKHKNTYQTLFGGFLSFLFLLIFILFTIMRSSDLFSFKSIHSSQEIHNQKLDGYGRLELTTKNFMFAFKFSNDVWNDRENPILPIKLYVSKKTRNESGVFQTDKEIEVVNCTLEHFPNLEEDFKLFNLHAAMCPNINNSFELEGGPDESIFNFIKLSVFSCENNIKCQAAQNYTLATLMNLGSEILLILNFFKLYNLIKKLNYL